MRRIIYACITSSLAVTGAISVAQAKQVVPVHSQDVQRTVSQAFRSIHVSADYGNVTLRPGATATVHAHEEWNLRQPTLAVSVRHHVLHVTISCNGDVSVGNTVTVVGALDQANDCIDSLTLAAPANVPVQADTWSGRVTAAGFHGGLKLSSDSGDVSIRNSSGPQVEASSGNGTVTGTHLHADAVALSSDSGDVVGTRIHAHSFTARSGNGAVTASSLVTTVLTATSDSGDVTLSGATVQAQADVHSGNGAVALDHVGAGSLDVGSDSGNVSLDKITSSSTRAESGDGTISATRFTGLNLTVADDAGDVNVADVTLRTLQATSGDGAVTARGLRAQTASLHSDAGNVTAALANKPQTLTATSGNGAVTLDVPSGRYDVQADSDDGTVHVSGLIVDTSVRPFIRAHSDAGDVTVTGH